MVTRREPPDHDPEETIREGMSASGTEVDEAETMASTGDASGSFEEIVSGTATGLGLDRGESIGTGGLAAGEDRDDVAEGDSWRQNLTREKFAGRDSSAERYELDEGTRLGWQVGADLDPTAGGFGPEREPGTEGTVDDARRRKAGDED